MKSQCFLVSNLLNQPIRFLQIPMYPRNQQDELGPRRFLNMVEKLRIGAFTEINLLHRFISNGCLWLRGIVVLNVEYEFRDWSSNSSECHVMSLGKSTLP